MTTLIDDKLDAIINLCREYDVMELAVFGSALRDDFNSESDVDFLVKFKSDDYGPWLAKLADFETALSSLLERPIDLVTKQSIEQSENYIRRKQILSSARTIYVAR